MVGIVWVMYKLSHDSDVKNCNIELSSRNGLAALNDSKPCKLFRSLYWKYRIKLTAVFMAAVFYA